MYHKHNILDYFAKTCYNERDMWEVSRLTLRGHFSLRALAALFTAAILTTLFGALLASTPVAAAPDKAEWQGNNVLYDGKEYQPDSTQNIPDVPPGATVFSRKDEANGKVSVLYYEQGADTTKDTKMKVREYTLNQDGTYSSPGPPADATLTAKKTDGNTTQCAVAGVGWIVCQMSRWIATGMDGIFKLIANYLVVQPITTDTKSALYQSWEIARSIANLCFVLAFLMIIYAQITSQGLNNYEIKKMIPKLIVAAVLVNISYYICAIAVDVSNILGQGIQQALVDIRKSIPQTGGTTQVTWKNATEYIMSGGTVVAAGVLGVKAFAGGAVAGSFSSLGLMLALVLVGALIAVLIAVIILAARQALIIVLIVASPLAFVAMLLPNTEKWFEKWKDLLTTMLLVFPMFSLLFGGSQLASHIVMGSTDDISVKLLALFIQAAPLVVTPFLVKFSGSLLGRFAGMMNDPQKGLVDRTRNWATDKAEAQRGRKFAEVAAGGGNRWQRMAYNRQKDQLNRDGWKKVGSNAVEAGWENDSRSHLQHDTLARLEAIKSLGESASHVSVEKMKATDPGMQSIIGKTYVNEKITENYKALEKAALEEASAGHAAGRFAAFATEAAQESREAKALAQRSAVAQAAQAKDYAKYIEEGLDPSLLREAAGIDARFGESRAIANSIKTRVGQRSEGLAAIETMMDVKNLSADELHRVATGLDVSGKFSGNEITHELREVAIKKIAGGANIQAINNLGAEIDLSTGSDEFWRTAFVDNLKTNSARPAHYSASLLDRLGQGVQGGFGQTGVEQAMLDAVRANKFDAKGLINNDPSTLEILNNVLSRVDPAGTDANLKRAFERAIGQISMDPQYMGAMGNRKGEITNIANHYGVNLPTDW